MRTIVRVAPPVCLGAQPRNQSWDAFARDLCHATVATALREEQHQLCCYCECELRDDDCHVEHLEPRSRNPSRTYDYDNLAASCNGGATEHCGHFKDNRRRGGRRYDATYFRPPHDPQTAALFRYRRDGSLDVAEGLDATQAIRARYMIDYLGLECARLTERRKAHARNLVDMLGSEPDPDLITFVRDHYLKPDEDGCLQPFFSLSQALVGP